MNLKQIVIKRRDFVNLELKHRGQFGQVAKVVAMSELTQSERLEEISVPSYKNGNDDGVRSSRSPFRIHLDDVLKSVDWKASDLTSEQLRLIATLIADKQRLLHAVNTLSEELEFTKKDADYDGLVPVLNKQAFERELGRQLSACYRYNMAACLIFMDLDNFKTINDRFGHATGDLALKKFGEVLVAHTRESDLIGRLGGDEFAVLLLNADQDVAGIKAKMFEDDVERIKFGDATSPVGFGLSCGITNWQRGEAAMAFLNRADEAMYYAKKSKARR